MNLNLRVARIKKNLSQAQLANVVGVTRQTILLIENEKFNPSLNLCISIAKALDQTLDELFFNHRHHHVEVKHDQ